MSDLTTVPNPNPSRLTSAIRHGLSAAWVAAIPMSVAMVGSADAQSGFPAEFDVAQLSATDGFRMDPDTTASDYYGVTSLAFSDINGDGFDDIAIGVAYGDTKGRGSVYVVFGSESGINGPLDLSNLDGTNGFRIEAEGNGNDIGRVVASAGNFNGDAFDDLLITTPSRTQNDSYGAAYVIFGAGDGFPATLSLADVTTSGGQDGFRIQAEKGDGGLGDTASFAGDFNGDGLDDIIIGHKDAYLDDARSYAGKAYVVFGTDQLITAPLELSTLNGSNGVRFDALVRGDKLGVSVAGGGDVNGDGIADVIMSAPSADEDPDTDRYTNEGRTYVVFGKNVENNGAFDSPFDLSSLDGSNGFSLEAEPGSDYLGREAVAGGGDFNGDGLSDVITESGNAGNASFGAAYVVFGAESPVSPDFQLDTLASGDGTATLQILGTAAEDYSMANSLAFGDINGDGLDDLIIGAYQADPDSRNNAGSVNVVFGQASNTSATFDLSDLDGDNGFRVLGENADDYLGKTLASGGDFNGDGVDDLLIGAPKDGDYSFQVYLLYGGVTGFNEIPQADATPSLLNFPSTEVDQTTETQTITVANPGTGPLSIGTLAFTGAQASDFVLSGDTCSGQTVAIDSDCTVDVAMTPTGTGTRSASLSIPSNALTSPEAVALSGEAFQVGEAALSSSALDFGSVVVGGSGKSEVVTITNSGPGDLTIGQLALSGADKADFVLSDDGCSNQTLATNESCTVTVEVSPNASGSKTATLTIPSDGETQTVSLATQAFDPVLVPTLSAWWLTWMAGLFGLLGWLGLRRS